MLFLSILSALCYFLVLAEAFLQQAVVVRSPFFRLKHYKESYTSSTGYVFFGRSLSGIKASKSGSEDIIPTSDREEILARALLKAKDIAKTSSEGDIEMNPDIVLPPVDDIDGRIQENIPTERRNFSAAVFTETLKEKSSVELAEFAGVAVKKTTAGLISATSGFIDGSISFLSSSEAEESRVALELSANAANAAGKSILKGLNAAKDEWNSVMNTGGEVGSPDQSIGKVVQAVQKVVDSAEVKLSLSEFGDSVVKTTKEVGAAGNLVVSGLGKQLSLSSKWKTAWQDVIEGLVMLYSTISVAGANAINPNKQLPDGR